MSPLLIAVLVVVLIAVLVWLLWRWQHPPDTSALENLGHLTDLCRAHHRLTDHFVDNPDIALVGVVVERADRSGYLRITQVLPVGYPISPAQRDMLARQIDLPGRHRYALVVKVRNPLTNAPLMLPGRWESFPVVTTERLEASESLEDI